LRLEYSAESDQAYLYLRETVRRGGSRKTIVVGPWTT
jgi:hypothetical protein